MHCESRKHAKSKITGKKSGGSKLIFLFLFPGSKWRIFVSGTKLKIVRDLVARFKQDLESILGHEVLLVERGVDLHHLKTKHLA
jgi:hypothetical protein